MANTRTLCLPASDSAIAFNICCIQIITVTREWRNPFSLRVSGSRGSTVTVDAHTVFDNLSVIRIHIYIHGILTVTVTVTVALKLPILGYILLQWYDFSFLSPLNPQFFQLCRSVSCNSDSEPATMHVPSSCPSFNNAENFLTSRQNREPSPYIQYRIQYIKTAVMYHLQFEKYVFNITIQYY